MAWLEECVERGGWTSLTQAANISVKDLQGREIARRPRLGIDQSTLSRWLNAETLPRPNRLREFIAALNGHISAGCADGTLLFVEPVSERELEEGLRLLAEARMASEAPAQRAWVKAQKELAEVFDGWSQWRAVYERLAGQLEEARTMAERLKRLQQGFEAADADATGMNAELAEALRRIHDLQDRYDRVHAECEMAREAAREERLQMQDDLSTARARVHLAEQDRKKARKEACALKEELARARADAQPAPPAAASAIPQAGALGGAERNASPPPPAQTPTGTGSTPPRQAPKPVAGSTPDGLPESTNTSAAAPVVGGYGYPVPPPPTSQSHNRRRRSVYWASHNTLALCLTVQAAASTAVGSGFGQLARAHHNTVWQLALYSLVGGPVLFYTGVFMFLVMDDLEFLTDSQRRSPWGQINEVGAALLLILAGTGFLLLAVFLPHWATGLDTLGGWLQTPLTPD
ncbi:hypothetical protein ACH41H_42310 [Streptomyces sp. NPDC020800]|uniref:hypothetical protein n=1 Tax=Streptomyces sp. NPDC020800 TaxID=3365092 RepID=UPI0037B09728